MGINVSASTVICADRGRVFAYAIYSTSEAEWIGGISESRMLTEPPVRVGTQAARTAKFLGRRIEYVNEVTELEADGKLAMRSVKGPFPMEIAYRFEDADGGTRMTIEIGGGPDGIAGLFSPIMGSAVKRSISKDLQRLKAIMERG